MFGPDEKLYVVIGDLNRNGQLQNYPAGPTPDDTSVILRLNDNGTIPIDNPFFAHGGNLAKYYAYGIRNSFGIAFDSVTNKVWDTENGPENYDEINLVSPGFNSGWEQIMGPDSRDPKGANDLFNIPGSGYVDPKFSWLNTVGPTAIGFLNSLQLGAQYQNDIFVGDINHGRLYRFKVNAARNGLVFQARRRLREKALISKLCPGTPKNLPRETQTSGQRFVSFRQCRQFAICFVISGFLILGTFHLIQLCLRSTYPGKG
jgi:glucose/arabinose dehydrogenase